MRAWTASLVALVALGPVAGAQAPLRAAITDLGGGKAGLFANHLAALAAAPKGDATMVSADVLLDGAEQAVDSALAALELQIQSRCERLPRGKQGFLEALLAALKDEPDESVRPRAEGYVAAALLAGGRKVENLGPQAREVADAILAWFDADPVRSCPPGFYWWSDQLTNVYRQDAVAATPLVVWRGGKPAVPALGEGPGEQLRVAKALTDAIYRAKGLQAGYDLLLSYYAAIYGPVAALTARDIRDVPDLAGLQQLPRCLQVYQSSGGYTVEWQLLPRLFAREPGLVLRLGGIVNGSGTPLTVQACVDAVRSKTATLMPRPDAAGYFDYEQNALAPMLVFGDTPEAKSKSIGIAPSYESRLLSRFGRDITTDRPTKVRKPGVRVAATTTGRARFAIEPLPTVYVRQARAVRVLRSGLANAIGSKTLGFVKGRYEDGSGSAASIARDLATVEARLVGCYVLSCEDLLIQPDAKAAGRSTEELAGAKEAALSWLDDLAHDPYVARDVRFIVPEFVGVDRKTRYWARVGVRLAKLEIVGTDPGFEPVRAWIGVDSYLEGGRPGAIVDTPEFRRELDQTPGSKTARRLVGAQGEGSWFRALLRWVCVLAAIGLLLFVAVAASLLLRRKPPPAVPRTQYAVRRTRAGPATRGGRQAP